MTHPVFIAPSLLAADFSRLREEVLDIEAGGAEWLHLDVMDGHFVPNLTIGPVVVKPLAALSSMVMDVHLMISDPVTYAREFVKVGAHWVTFHAETGGPDLVATAGAIAELGVKVGVSVKPGTPVDVLTPVLGHVGMVLIMSVEPGFGGQKWMGEVLTKATWLKEQGYGGIISMDGGIGVANARATAAAGVDVLVAGTSVFGQKDRAQAIAAIRDEALAGLAERPAEWPRPTLV